jgi:hypothetical protein
MKRFIHIQFYPSDALKDCVWKYYFLNGNVDRHEHSKEGMLMFFEEFQY